MGQRPYVSPDGQAVGSIEHDPDCLHPQDQVERVGECAQGCCTDYHCTACGTRFRFEWPD
jgi:hypothetical protein